MQPKKSPQPQIRLLSKLLDRSLWLTNSLAATAAASMTLVILLQVFCRYVLNDALPWSEEAARYLMVWMTFLALPSASRQLRHASLVFVRDLLPKAMQWVLQFLITIAVIIVLLVAIQKSFDFAVKGRVIMATSLPFAKSWAYSAMPVGFSLTLLVYVELLLIQMASLLPKRQGDMEFANSEHIGG